VAGPEEPAADDETADLAELPTGQPTEEPGITETTPEEPQDVDETQGLE
jgi:hypothetical protein